MSDLWTKNLTPEFREGIVDIAEFVFGQADAFGVCFDSGGTFSRRAARGLLARRRQFHPSDLEIRRASIRCINAGMVNYDAPRR
jgi:hypothetical protein